MTLIRPATAADADAIAAVHVQAHLETYARHFGRPTGRPPWNSGRRALAGPGRAYVACADSRIVGFGHHHGHEITSLYLLADWQSPSTRRRGHAASAGGSIRMTAWKT